MTLIEILIVVALIAIMSGFAISNLSGYFKVSLDSATRGIANKIRETYNSTVVTGLVHRMAYDLENAQYWVEVGSSAILLDTSETRKKESERRSLFFDKKKKKNPFKLAEDVTPKKADLPQGVVFEDIITDIGPEPLTQGVVYTHFFPQGAAERTIIHLKNREDRKYTLVISSIGGRTKLYPRKVGLDETEKD